MAARGSIAAHAPPARPGARRAAPRPPRAPPPLRGRCRCRRPRLRPPAAVRGRHAVSTRRPGLRGRRGEGSNRGGAPCREQLTTCSGRPDLARRRGRGGAPAGSCSPPGRSSDRPTTILRARSCGHAARGRREQRGRAHRRNRAGSCAAPLWRQLSASQPAVGPLESIELIGRAPTSGRREAAMRPSRDPRCARP